jgi:hypothetical protein
MFKRDLDFDRKWAALMKYLQETVGKRPKDLNAVLFLIGVQELGRGAVYFSKEEKQDLMHIAICKVLSLSGYYELAGQDADGWPHWTLKKKLPHVDLLSQEKLLKMHVIEFFEKEYNWVYAGFPSPENLSLQEENSAEIPEN